MKNRDVISCSEKSAKFGFQLHSYITVERLDLNMALKLENDEGHNLVEKSPNYELVLKYLRESRGRAPYFLFFPSSFSLITKFAILKTSL